MSVNIPPNPNVSTFNNLYWIQGDNSLTTAEGDLRYLKFPVAQGTENLQTTNVNGVLTANSGVNFTSVNPPTSSQVIPASNDSSTKIPTTAWVQSAITGGSSNTLTDVLIAGNSAGLQPINMNNQNISAVNTLSFATTSQTSAYTGGAAGTYTDTNMTIDANGKISAISSGAAASSVLTGSIIAFAGNSVPTGYLLCDSTQYDTTTYATLFAVLGYTYGGTGAFFNVPNLVNNFIKGATQSLGATESGLFVINNNNIQLSNVASIQNPLSGGNTAIALNSPSGIANWFMYKGKAAGDGSVNVWTPESNSGSSNGTNLIDAFTTPIGVAVPTALTGNVPNYLMRYIIKF